MMSDRKSQTQNWDKDSDTGSSFEPTSLTFGLEARESANDAVRGTSRAEEPS